MTVTIRPTAMARVLAACLFFALVLCTAAWRGSGTSGAKHINEATILLPPCAGKNEGARAREGRGRGGRARGSAAVRWRFSYGGTALVHA